MVSSTTFRDKMHIFMGIASVNGMTFKMTYKQRVWLVSLEPTKDKVPRFNPRYRSPIKKGSVPMPIENCTSCYSLVVGGICINKRCPTNLKVMAEETKAVE